MLQLHVKLPISGNAPGGMPSCPKCGNNRQVWENQISGKLKCHRAFCDTEIPEMENEMKDVELPPLPEMSYLGDDASYGYDNCDMREYARAAIEADRAQRVPHQVYLSGRTLIDAARRDWPSTATHRARVLEAASALESALLASTPAPAQQETTRDELDFDSDDAINRQQRNLACALALGQQVGCSRRQGRSNPETEKAFRLAVTAIAKPIAIAVAQNCNSVPQLTFSHIYLGLSDLFSEHQEPPQPVERKPMTDDQDRALCEAFCNAASDEYFKARPQLDSDVNRRIFYAGHRKAWLEWQTAHGIKE